jgi:hypothetical protein
MGVVKDFPRPDERTRPELTASTLIEPMGFIQPVVPDGFAVALSLSR